MSANKTGRASVAALAFGARPERRALPTNGAATACRPDRSAPLSVVEAEPSVQPLLKALLGRTFIAPDLAAATAAWREIGRRVAILSRLTGDLLSRHGIFTGGYLNGHGIRQGAGFDPGPQKPDRRIAGANWRHCRSASTKSAGSKGALLSEQTELQASLQQAQTELREQEVAIATREGEFNALQNSARLLHQKIETVVYEIKAWPRRKQEGAQKRAGAGRTGRRLGNARARRPGSGHALDGRAGKLAPAARRRQRRADRNQGRARDGGTVVRLLPPAETSRWNSASRELTQLVEQRRAEIQSFLDAQEAGRIGDRRSRASKIEASAASSANRSTRKPRELIGAEGCAGGAKSPAREEDLREQRRGLERTAETARRASKSNWRRKTCRVQNLRERIQQKYHLNLDDIRSECITITLADEGPAKVQTLTPEEMAASGAATDWDAVGAAGRRRCKRASTKWAR